MIWSLIHSLILLSLPFALFSHAQSSAGSGYIGYSLSETGDPSSAVYDTVDTPANVSTTVPEPDVYLNASVSVGEIDITVTNLTAKINIDAQVLQLLQFNAGVTASIDSVSLIIRNVTAHVLLEARLSNLVMMISDVLDSLDLNPVLATLSQDVTSIVSTAESALTSSSTLAARSFEVEDNILYSVNDYSGNTHANRVLMQNGSIVDQFLHNDGYIYNQQIVGYYLRDMTFNGYNQSVIRSGQVSHELEYVYTPFAGLFVVSAIYTNGEGTVVGTQVLSESGGGGGSSIGGVQMMSLLKKVLIYYKAVAVLAATTANQRLQLVIGRLLGNSEAAAVGLVHRKFRMVFALTARNRAVILGVFVVTVICLCAKPLQYFPRTPSQQLALEHQPLSKDAFVLAATQSALDYYNATALERYCAHDAWDGRSVMNCHRIFGGIGNTRQRILACVSTAMFEGFGLILPTLLLRNEEDLSVLDEDGRANFNSSFDRDLFIHRITSACPRMVIYESLEVAAKKGLEIIRFPSTMAQQSICEDPSDFAINLGHILTFPPSIYRLAYTGLYALSLHEKLSISPTPIGSTSPSFLSVHLRTAADAIAMGWPNYETQSTRYLHLATTLAVPVIYVASGNASSIALFAREAARLLLPVKVVSKYDILSGSDLAELRSLSWDQAAQVDYVLSESAGFFAGIAESSFSWNVAMKRAAMAGGPSAVCGRASDTAQNVVWEDNWSVLYGETQTLFSGVIWP